MDIIQFLKTCDFEEFSEWLEKICISDSFKNIQEGKSFNTIIINNTDYEDERAYYLIHDKDSLKCLFNVLRDYANLEEDEQDVFDLVEETRFFIYSYPEQFTECNHEDIINYRNADNIIIIHEETSN